MDEESRLLWELTGATILLAILLATGFSAASAVAQERIPGKATTVIVNSPPGGLAENMTRLLAGGLAEKLGSPVTVEMRPGADGAVGAMAVLRAPADGYTLLSTISSTMTMLPFINKDISYSAERDFVIISQLAGSGVAVVAPPSTPVNSAQELIEFGKASPGKLNWGITGAGNRAALATLAARSGARFTDVPYSGGAFTIAAVLGGQVDLAFLTFGSAKPHVDAGKLKFVAVTSLKRNVAFPSVPSIAEVVPGWDFTSWQGLYVKSGTAADWVQRLNREVSGLVQSSSFREFLARYYYDVIANTPQQAAAAQRAELDQNAKIVKDFGIVLN